MLMEDVFVIAGTRIGPGELGRIRVPVGEQNDGNPVWFPLLVQRGQGAGPIVWINGVIHGTEIAGAEIIRRVMDDLRARKDLSGTVLGAPITNVLAYRSGTYVALEDHSDPHQSFPGNARGTLSERLAHAIATVGLDRADDAIHHRHRLDPRSTQAVG